jgi:hypothetical protein
MNSTYIKSKSKGLLGHDVIEVLARDLASIGGGSLQHLFKLLNSHSLSKFLCNSLDVVCIDGSCFIVIEKVEYFVDPILYSLRYTRDSLSPSFEVMASKNSSKSISRP